MRSLHYVKAPTLPMPGEMNGDGKVGLQSLQLLANTYDSKHGDSNWNQNADIALPNGVMGLSDLVTMAMHYGQENP